MNGAITMDPSSGTSWTQLAPLYDQFRVVGGQLKLVSVQSNVAAGVLNSLVRFVFDNDSSNTPSSYSDIASYSEITDLPAVWTSGAVKTVNFKRPMIRGVLQSQQNWFQETVPSTSPGALKFYGDGLTANTYYYRYAMDYLVEFQMRSS